MSGYSVVPGFVMGGIARRTAAHYEAGWGEDGDGRCGNYGAWGVLDWVGGTGMGGRGWDGDVREEGGKKAGEAMLAIGEGLNGLKKGGRRGRRRAGGNDSD